MLFFYKLCYNERKGVHTQVSVNPAYMQTQHVRAQQEHENIQMAIISYSLYWCNRFSPCTMQEILNNGYTNSSLTKITGGNHHEQV